MLKLFSTGLVANLIYVLSGALKQYLIAAQLVVADVGIYGAWVAQASLLMVLVPLPAYLDVLIKGFSAAPDNHPLRGALVGGVIREMRMLGTGAAVLLAGALIYALVSGTPHPTLIALLLLLVSQYVGQTADILLRMYQAHQRYAAFMATRNLPSVALILLLGLDSPTAIVLVELLSAAIVGGLAYRSRPLRLRDRSAALPPARLIAAGEQVMLWLARLVQYVNASLLRLVVPFIFGAHATGLFFFACIAQIPASLFLSVTTQMFGHTLARIQRGEWRAAARIQFIFLLPNLLYVIAMALLVPYWAWFMHWIPGLVQYAQIGALVFAVALYSSVLSSDAQEYLLRSRGLSSMLLQYNLGSIAAQIVCLLGCSALGFEIERTIMFCAIVAGMVLIGFSVRSFRFVIGDGVRAA